MTDRPLTYREAGVDRQAARTLVEAAHTTIRQTFSPRVLGDVGHFGGLFHLGDYRDPVLVSTIDGVGTKTLLAAEAGRLDVVGRDVVAHGVNDVAVLGAVPMFMLDYIASAQLDPKTAAQVLEGMASACQEEGVALIGGETAQMPGIYRPEGLDIVGCMVGVVEREDLCDGTAIRPGDALVGLASTGLHTNGYSLARAVLQRTRWSLDDTFAEFGGTLANALLAPHRSYRRALLALHRAGWMRGAAHITGGGIPGNLVRILPPGCRARVETRVWPVPPIFTLLGREGNIPRDEMFATFNMGIGLIAVTSAERAGLAMDICRVNGAEAWIIGEVLSGDWGVDVV